ncbi:hypothetical protein B0H10DRAFT_711984 [Mycena sp. CBHHK59/15]|nr:hypothetical protein B0H10DRAFT_711984 [Mycena sp. CBHHK59/15]
MRLKVNVARKNERKKARQRQETRAEWDCSADASAITAYLSARWVTWAPRSLPARSEFRCKNTKNKYSKEQGSRRTLVLILVNMLNFIPRRIWRGRQGRAVHPRLRVRAADGRPGIDVLGTGAGGVFRSGREADDKGVAVIVGWQWRRRRWGGARGIWGHTAGGGAEGPDVGDGGLGGRGDGVVRRREGRRGAKDGEGVAGGLGAGEDDAGAGRGSCGRRSRIGGAAGVGGARCAAHWAGAAGCAGGCGDALGGGAGALSLCAVCVGHGAGVGGYRHRRQRCRVE